jgi:Transglycosylase-like domain
VTVLWRAFAASSESVRRGAASAARAAAPALCSLGIAAMLCATLWVAAAPAGADPVATLQEEAASLSQQMLLEQLQIGGFEQQRAAYMKAAASDDARLRQLDAQLALTRLDIVADRSHLRDAAIRTYVEGGTAAGGVSGLFAVSPSESATTVYAQVVDSDLTSAVDRFQSGLRSLHAEQAAEEQITSDAHAQVNGADAALADAQSTQQTLVNQRVSITGQLAVAQAQAEAATREATEKVVQRASEVSGTPDATAAPEVSATTSASAVSSDASTSALPQLNPFLTCVVQAESDGEYQAVSPTGLYMGAFQFAQGTWNEAASLAGMPTLAGVPPYEASMRDQDLLAIALYNADGEQPWYDPCHS